MTLDDRQWGRILALAWLDDEFRSGFEQNPAKAFETLRTREHELRKNYGDTILDNLGIRDPNVSLSNFEVMLWDSVDFWGMPGEQLDKCIQGDLTNELANIVPGESPWSWNGLSAPALEPAPASAGKARTLTAKEWVRIYARIWMDHRLDEPALDQQWKTKYGPQKKGYVAQFEENPASTVRAIVDEFNTNFNAHQDGWNEFQYDHTNPPRLYAVKQPPASELDTDTITTIVKTGLPGNQPLVWEINKCL